MSWEDRVQTPFQIITSTSTIIGKCTTTSIHGIIYMNSGNRFVDKKGINDACRVWYLLHQYSHYIKHVIYSVTITWQHYYPSIVTRLLLIGHVTIPLEPLSRSEELQWKLAEMSTNMDLPLPDGWGSGSSIPLSPTYMVWRASVAAENDRESVSSCHTTPSPPSHIPSHSGGKYNSNKIRPAWNRN